MPPENANQRLNGNGWKYILKPINAESLIQKVNETIAQQTMVLQDPAITMSQIGIDPGAFAEVVEKFAETVNEKIIRLEQQADNVSADVVDLRDLLEGAKLVRAERLTKVLTSLENSWDEQDQEVVRSTTPLLLRELKVMQYHLNLYSS